MELNEKLLLAKKIEQLTEDELGHRIGVAGERIHDWENGMSIDIGTVQKLASFFGMSLDYFASDKPVTEEDRKWVERIDLYNKEVARQQAEKERLAAELNSLVDECKAILSQFDCGYDDSQVLPSLDNGSINLGCFAYSADGKLRLSKEELSRRDQKDLLKAYELSVVSIPEAILKDDVEWIDAAFVNFDKAIKGKDFSSFGLDSSEVLKLLEEYGFSDASEENLADYVSGHFDEFELCFLNNILETLPATMKHYYHTIVGLVQIGAYYKKDELKERDGTLYKKIVKDSSKTSFIFRQAQDMLSLKKESEVTKNEIAALKERITDEISSLSQTISEKSRDSNERIRQAEQELKGEISRVESIANAAY